MYPKQFTHSNGFVTGVAFPIQVDGYNRIIRTPQDWIDFIDHVERALADTGTAEHPHVCQVCELSYEGPSTLVLWGGHETGVCPSCASNAPQGAVIIEFEDDCEVPRIERCTCTPIDEIACPACVAWAWARYGDGIPAFEEEL